MAEPAAITRAEDPLQHLRASIDAHRQVTQASVDAGKQLQAEREQPQPQPEPQQ